MYKILIVDDEKVTLDIVSDYLRDFGYEIETAKDGEEGWLSYLTFQPDMLITDYNMPKKDGISLSKDVLKKDPYMKIIILSANYGISKIAKEMGIKFIPKPFKFDELKKTIDDLFGKES